MTSEPRAMKEIHDIRLKIQEKTEGMTPEQEMEYYAAAVRRFEKRRGIKFRRPKPRSTRKAI